MSKYIAILATAAIITSIISCSKNEIAYQDGYPNRFAGNWYATDFINFNIDTLGRVDIDDIHYNSGAYELVIAVDPNAHDSIIIDNVFNQGYRIRCVTYDNKFTTRKGAQLNYFINDSNAMFFDIRKAYMVNGNANNPDMLFIQVIQYDYLMHPSEPYLIYATRKTGWEEYEINEE